MSQPIDVTHVNDGAYWIQLVDKETSKERVELVWCRWLIQGGGMSYLWFAYFGTGIQHEFADVLRYNKITFLARVDPPVGSIIREVQP